MKNKIHILILLILMFTSIKEVKADREIGTFYGECSLKEESMYICNYSCSVSGDDEYAKGQTLNFDYNIDYTKNDNVEKFSNFVTNKKYCREGIFSSEQICTNSIFGGVDEGNQRVLNMHSSSTPTLSRFYNDGVWKCPGLSFRINSSYGHMQSLDIYDQKVTFIFYDINDNDGSVDTTDHSVCGLLGGEQSKTVNFIKKIYGYIKVIIPLLIIILGITDFIKVIVSGKDDDMKKSINKFAKRIILAVVFILTPILISILINISGLSSQYDGLSDGIKAIFCILE